MPCGALWSHTELKVAVRTCEGKAIHGRHRISPRICAYLLVFFWTTNEHEFTLMPCGALWSHADGADFRKSMRSKFCAFLCFLCATTFDIRTKGHNASRPLRLCVKTKIYIFDIRTKEHNAPRPLCENKYVLMFFCLTQNSVSFRVFRVKTKICSYVLMSFLKNCVQRTAWHSSLLTASHIIYIIFKSIFIQYAFHNSIIMSNFAQILEWYSSLLLMNLRPKGELE